MTRTTESTAPSTRAPRMKREARRQQLLQVATELIMESGVRALTMERVAERAEVSKPVIYAHFENSSALMLDVLSAYWSELDKALDERLAGAETLADDVRAMVEGYFDLAEVWGDVLLPLVTGAALDDPIELVRRAHHHRTEKRWSATFVERLDVPKPEADLLAATLRMAVVGAVTHWARQPDLDRKEASEVCCRFFTEGLARFA